MLSRICIPSLVFLLAGSALPVFALGTAQVRQHDGQTKTYKNVTIKMNGENLAVFSSDKAAVLVVGKASCTTIGSLVRCLPYDAVLTQYGSAYHIPVKTGTLWVNPTRSNQALNSESAKLQPHGVLLKMQTKAGTAVSLTGVLDETQK